MLYRSSEPRSDDPWYRRSFEEFGERWPATTTLIIATALSAQIRRGVLRDRLPQKHDVRVWGAHAMTATAARHDDTAWIGRVHAALRRRWALLHERAEAGFVSLYVVVITVGLLAMAGLVIDGGNAIAAREQATDAAQQASRAGADALSPDSLRGSPTGLTASPAAAQAAANRVLAAAGVTGTVTVAVAGDSVTVTVVVHKSTTILSAVGVTDISGTATATATALHGTTTGG